MDSRREAIGDAAENPAAAADAEQHARQDLAGLSARVAARLPRSAPPLVAAGALVFGWLILRRRRKSRSHLTADARAGPRPARPAGLASRTRTTAQSGCPRACG